jgi:hypothetical protein
MIFEMTTFENRLLNKIVRVCSCVKDIRVSVPFSWRI